MTKTEGGSYRYVKKKSKEHQQNAHIREMIAVYKNEKIKANLYVKNIKLSNHAFKRFSMHFNICDITVATRKVREMLKQATRIGTVLSYDGRVNVLYAYDQTAIFLSPDLKTVVTINKYQKETCEICFRELKSANDYSVEFAREVHYKHLNKLEEQEKEMVEKILKIENKVSEATKLCETLLEIGRGGRERKKQIKTLISQQNLELKREGSKLFNLQIRKRHICKSIVLLY